MLKYFSSFCIFLSQGKPPGFLQYVRFYRKNPSITSVTAKSTRHSRAPFALFPIAAAPIKSTAKNQTEPKNVLFPDSTV